jgi:hypothetical protein
MLKNNFLRLKPLYEDLELDLVLKVENENMLFFLLLEVDSVIVPIRVFILNKNRHRQAVLE